MSKQNLDTARENIKNLLDNKEYGAALDKSRELLEVNQDSHDYISLYKGVVTIVGTVNSNIIIEEEQNFDNSGIDIPEVTEHINEYAISAIAAQTELTAS